MFTIKSNEVRVKLDDDEHEDEVSFVFPHPTRGWDCLTLAWGDSRLSHGTSGVWVSRRMPIHSGYAGIESLSLRRNELRIIFAPQLAEALEMDREVMVSFAVQHESEFLNLRQAFARMFRDYRLTFDLANESQLTQETR